MPLLEFCPAVPPESTSLLYEAPSTYTLTASGGCPPAANVLSVLLTAVAVTPGTSLARSRMLRSKLGRLATWSRVMLAPTSDVRVVCVAVAFAVTCTDVSCTAVSAVDTLMSLVSAMPTETCRSCGARPMRRTAIS